MMPLTKLWLFLLSLLCGLAALLVVALDPELQRREIATQSQAVARAQKISSQFLENQAQKLVQTAVQLSTDAVLQESLSQLARSQGEPAILHETAQTALRRVTASLSLSFALVTDLRGHVLSRVGQDEAVYGDPLDGLPAVEAALRGYRLDDLWLFQGALYRIAAVPVIAQGGAAQGHDRYVGVLVIARVLGSDLLAQMGQLTGVQGAFVARGQILAHSLSSVGKGTVFLGQPDGGMALSSEALLLARRNLATPDGVVRDGDQFLAFVDLPGTAAGAISGPAAASTKSEQGALLVLSSRGGSGRILPLVLRESLRQGLAPVTLAVLLGAVLLLYVLGLGVVGSESRLLALSQGSRRGSRPTSTGAEPSRSEPEIRQAEPRPVDRSPTSPTEERAPEPAPAVPPRSSPPAAGVSLPYAPPPSTQSPRMTPPPSTQSPRMTPPPSTQSPRTTPPPLSSTRTPPPALALQEDTSTPLPPPLPQRSDWGSPEDLPSDSQRELAGAYDHTDLGLSDAAETRAAPLPQPSSNFEPTVVAAAPNGATDPDVTFYQVFQEYVQARERCRESVEGLSYEQFRKRLADSRATIIREHGCVSVEFHVYVKDGRAALKAVPQWAPLPPPLLSPISGP